MTMTQNQAQTLAPSVLITEAVVHSVTRLGPAFVRIELASPAFVDLGEDGYDTRFKSSSPDRPARCRPSRRCRRSTTPP